MEEQLKDDVKPTAIDQKPPIDPLRRVWVPREVRTLKGTLVFRTLDDQVYARLADGSIRRAHPKVNGKLAKKLRRKERGAHGQA